MKYSFMISLMGVIAALVMAPGCATVADPPPPDLDRAQQSLQMRQGSVDASENALLSDLERLADLRLGIGELATQLEATPLPLPLLRLVAMNCLNTEYQGLSQPVAGLEGTPLTCRPTHASRLLERLANLPTADADKALELLYIIDQSRLLRGSLRQRLAQFGDVVSDHREFIANERADLRQIEADLRRRRGRYSTRGWRDAMNGLDDHRRQLQEFSERLDEFSDQYPQWPGEVDDLMAQIYFELIELRPAQDMTGQEGRDVDQSR